MSTRRHRASEPIGEDALCLRVDIGPYPNILCRPQGYLMLVPLSPATAMTLLSCIQQLCCPDLTPEAAIYLNFKAPNQHELAVTFLLAVGFKFIWDQRVMKKPVTKGRLRAELIARNNILAMSKCCHISSLLQQTVQDFPT